MFSAVKLESFSTFQDTLATPTGMVLGYVMLVMGQSSLRSAVTFCSKSLYVTETPLSNRCTQPASMG